MNKTFDFYRSTNQRFVSNIYKQDDYSRYLKRIEDIVNKKPSIDYSISKHMKFLNKIKETSRNHHSMQYLGKLKTQNTFLLTKILKTKNRKGDKLAQKYEVALHQKRLREQHKINDQNKKLACRVINQNPTIHSRQKSLSPVQLRQSRQRNCQKTFYQTFMKERKLPKLLQMRS